MTTAGGSVIAGVVNTTHNVELDQRCFLFPDGKALSQLRITAVRNRDMTLDGVFPFNRSRRPPTIAVLGLPDAREFTRRLIEAVYRAQTGFVVTDTCRVTVNVIANGYLLQFGDPEDSTDLFLSTGVIWRVCSSLLRALDEVAPVAAN